MHIAQAALFVTKVDRYHVNCYQSEYRCQVDCYQVNR